MNVIDGIQQKMKQSMKSVGGKLITSGGLKKHWTKFIPALFQPAAVRKTVAIGLAAAIVLGVCSGCESGDAGKPASNGLPGPVSENNSLPIAKEKITMKYWAPYLASNKRNEDNLVYQELEKRTNIHFQFIYPVLGQELEQFYLMIASNELPDIIQNPPAPYPGGPDAAIADGVYLRLNELIDQYAPDYNRYRNSNRELRIQTMTEEGNIYTFDCIQLAEEKPWDGLIIRKDWLKELDLEMPVTIEDWHTVLTEFKNRKNATAPFIFNAFPRQLELCGAICSAYGVINDFYNENGTVRYGVIEPGYKEFLATMNQWYQEGLIDPDFNTRDPASNDALFTSGRGGAMYQWYSLFGGYNTKGRELDPDFELVGVPSPVKNPGDKLHFRQTCYYDKETPAIITTACKYPEEAVKWLNYAYTDEGFLLYNYGVEGISWKWVDGPVPALDYLFYPKGLRGLNKHPEFTELMTKNPEGIAFWDLVPKYKIHQYAELRDPYAYGPFAGDILDSMEAWSQAGHDYMMPLFPQTQAEDKKINEIMNAVKAYVNDMQVQFIMGTEPLDHFDAFVSHIRRLGIEEAIRCKQSGLDRYIKRLNRDMGEPIENH
jgi:putative aldouronate transport system substrate-binding protein